MRWFQALLPKEDDFFRLFAEHADTLIKGADALSDMLQGGDGVPACCARIVDHEHEADAVAREVLLAVRRSFITPFDRSDIRGLTNSLDDAIDQMQKTAKIITLYEVRDFTPQMQDLGALAVKSAALTREAVGLLPDMQKNRVRLNELTEQVARLESESDDVYDAGLKALFHAHRDNGAMAFITGREIYDHLEKVVDRFEDVSNHINGILVEHL